MKQASPNPEQMISKPATNQKQANFPSQMSTIGADTGGWQLLQQPPAQMQQKPQEKLNDFNVVDDAFD